MASRVLVVEDDLLNRMFICAALESHGFAVESVSDGAEAIAAAQAFDPDLITMDINLPNVSGLTLIKKLKADAKLKQVPIVAITAYVGKGEESRIRRAGASDYMSKPIAVKPFLASVDRLLSEG